MRYGRAADSCDRQFRAGLGIHRDASGALQGFVLFEKQADHYRTLRESYERAAWRPWESVRPEPQEPTLDTLRPGLGSALIRLAAGLLVVRASLAADALARNEPGRPLAEGRVRRCMTSDR